MHRALVAAVFGLDENRRFAAIVEDIVLYRNIAAHPALVPVFRVVGEKYAAHGRADKMIVFDIYLAARGDKQSARNDAGQCVADEINIRTRADILYCHTDLRAVSRAQGQFDIIVVDKLTFFDNRLPFFEHCVGISSKRLSSASFTNPTDSL